MFPPHPQRQSACAGRGGQRSQHISRFELASLSAAKRYVDLGNSLALRRLLRVLRARATSCSCGHSGGRPLTLLSDLRVSHWTVPQAAPAPPKANRRAALIGCCLKSACRWTPEIAAYVGAGALQRGRQSNLCLWECRAELQSMQLPPQCPLLSTAQQSA